MSKFISGIKGTNFTINNNGILNNTALSSSYASTGVYTGLSSSTNAGMELVGASGTALSFIDFSYVNVDYRGRIMYNHTLNEMQFYTNASVDKAMFINSSGTLTGAPGTTASFFSSMTDANSYNMVLAATSNTGPTRLVIFVNGSSYTGGGDGSAVNSATVRNDNGQLNLGNIFHNTRIIGSTVNILSTGAITYTVNGTQRVNMGTVATPDLYALSVNGTARVNNTNTLANKLLVLFDNAPSDAYSSATNFSGFGVQAGILRYQGASSVSHVFYAGSTQTMYLSETGQLTATSYVYSPKILLNMSGTNTSLIAPEVIAQNVNITPAGGTEISASIAMIGKFNTGAGNYSGGQIKSGTLYLTNNFMSFGLFADGVLSEKMRLVDNNFGIGTSSPQSALHVTSNIYADEDTSTAGVHAGVHPGPSWPNYAALRLFNGTSSTGGGVIQFSYPGSTAHGYIYYSNNTKTFTLSNEFGALIQAKNNAIDLHENTIIHGDLSFSSSTFSVITRNVKNTSGYLILGTTAQDTYIQGASVSVDRNFTVEGFAAFTSSSSANARFDSTSLQSDSGQKSVVAQFKGYVMATGYYSSSDRRTKVDIIDIDDNRLSLLNPVSYNLIDSRLSNKKQYGLIAQDVEKIYPEIVNTSCSYLPNIMQFGAKTDATKFTIETELNFYIGKELSCYITLGDTKEEQTKCKIISIENDIITIDHEFDEIFVYGTYENDVKSVNYEAIIPLLLKDSQQKSEQINKLESEINNLKTLVQSSIK